MQFNAKEMSELNIALEKAFAAMQENLKKVQDTADNALEEVRKEGTLHGKTNDALAELGKKGEVLAGDFKGLRDRLVEAEQKLAARGPQGDPEKVKSVVEIITESVEYKAAQKQGRMDPVEVKSFHSKAAILNATGQNQPLVPSQRLEGVISPAEQRLFIRDLIPQAVTTSNLIEFARETAFTNSAAPQGSGSSPAETEGQPKAESALSFDLANSPVITLAHWVPASRQVLSDASMLQGHISGRLLYGLKLVEEQNLLTANGTAGQLTGLNSSAAAYNRGSTGDTILDTLLKAMLQVSLSNYEASAYVLHPTDWFSAMLLKDTQGRYLFSDPQSMVQPRVWSKPVVASQTQTQGKFLCGAFNLGAQIWDREDATVRISENVNDHFIRNMVAILAEERLALTIYRASAFVYGNTAG